ncbi:MAG: potassium-transporting ATPase subunit KdpA [Gammaproteobacteria bacterium]|nr:potassium-transporting ATPase subunit KdpA [Gammaproteobacteria bacterium]
MTVNAILQVSIFFIVLYLFAKPLGKYIAKIYSSSEFTLPFEKTLYRLCGITFREEMNWKQYAFAVLWFNFFGILIVYAIQRLQLYLPLNPQHFTNVPPDLAFNTAASFVTNTNWQAYGGETTMSYFTQMAGLTVQNFLSAATGIAVLMAFIRGFMRYESETLGNFWVDLVRSTLFILLPLAIVLSLFLTSQGVIQNFKPYQTTHLLQPIQVENKTLDTQVIPMGPVASQVAIKQLGTNGGGFFNTNSAHPFENPTPLTNFFEMIAILLIPAALCFTFGRLMQDKRQGRAIFFAMLIILIPCTIGAIYAEQIGNPALTSFGIDQHINGNMEGKETRFGIVNSALWAASTTATSNGSVNSMHDSFMPLGGLIPLWLMHLGEVVFGGVGCGLYGMLMLVIITVFISGLMVGRTPEYLNKKIEPYEMKMACFAVLLMPMIVLILTGFASITTVGISSIANPGAHGLSEILYAFTSMGNNNGSAFAGLSANTLFYNTAGGIEMLLMRFWLIIPVLAIAGSLVKKRKMIPSSGTLPTHTPFFVILLIAITLIVGALTFFPVLALGPIVEHLMLWRTYG